MTRSPKANRTKDAPPIDIVTAMNHPKLFEPWFRGASWDGWRAVVKAIYALSMTEDEVKFFKSVAGGRNPPKRPVREFYAAAARRSGKDSAISGVAAFSAAFFDHQDRLRPGERAVVLCLACDQSQAKIILNYVRAFFTDIPMLRAMVQRETKTGFELSNGVDITVSTNDYRSVRGRPVLLVVLDELAFFRSEDSASPDIELYNALRPALASLPGSRIIGISSPYRKVGLLWDKYRKHFGKDDDDVLVIQAATRTLNPTISEEVVNQALEEDPAAARAEWLGEFRDDIGGYVSLELIEAAVEGGVTVRPPVKGIVYRSGVDPSGGAKDSYTCAVAHQEGNASVLDCVLEIKSPFNPSTATEQIAATLKSYGITETVGDRYAAQWVVDAFAKCGIKYRHSDRDRSQIYSDMLPLFTSGRAQLLDNSRLVNQFAGLEVKALPLGKTRIDHSPGSFDDLCNAAALAMVLAASPGIEQHIPIVGPEIISNGNGVLATVPGPSRPPAHYLKPGGEPWRGFVDNGGHPDRYFPT